MENVMRFARSDALRSHRLPVINSEAELLCTWYGEVQLDMHF